MSALKQLSSNKCFGGFVQRFQHLSAVLGCEMKFSVFLPPNASSDRRVPVIYYLSGLTCTDENFITKAGAQRAAAKHGIALICPDTSPRGVPIEGDHDSWDFGVGAGFYVNATEEKWARHYRMYDYVTRELPTLVNQNLPVDPARVSIFGHSMGGHGALICALKNPGLYKTVSAFAPICNPINCPWGQKAFRGYLGENQEAWKEWDATCLVKGYNGPPLDILIDQGTADNFLPQGQLLPEAFEAASRENSHIGLKLRMQEGYDHGYYFIATFIEDHIEHHAALL
jgi:S-formylglutathione hydrolase